MSFNSITDFYPMSACSKIIEPTELRFIIAGNKIYNSASWMPQFFKINLLIASGAKENDLLKA